MKKLLAMLLAMVMVLSLAACAGNEDEPTQEATEAATEAPVEEATEAPVEEGIETPDEVITMTYAEYVAAELDAPVVVECYVQDHQSWWDNKITVYAADADGAYFLYEMACSEEDAANLVPGTKICVTGYKSEWSGEVEIVDATFTFVEGADTYIAEPIDVTALLGTDELIDYQNQLASFTGMTVEAISYKNDEPGDDIYVTLSLDGVSYDFCVEVYLTGTDSEVYTTVGTLNVGDVVDVEGFLYWYEGVNPHITAIALAA